MAEVKYDLLSEGLIGIQSGRTRETVSLPAVLSALSSNQPIEFTALRPHQHHAWHAFLVQMAALVLANEESSQPHQEEEAWRDGLLRLTDDRTEPWCLYVEDLSQPAFFQPPVPEKTLEVLKTEVVTPDGLDILVLARNHDLKQARIHRPDPEHWIHALVTLQTMEGFSGRANYGIARMNSGFGNRPCVSAAPDLTWPSRFSRDLGVWLEAREELIAEHGYRSDDGFALLWLPPWKGEKSLALSQCDPFFIEICRRARLKKQNGSLVARVGNSQTQRVDAKELKGNTGDIWTPLRREDAAALTIGSEGFSFKKLHEVLLSGDYAPSPAQELREEDGRRPCLIVQALARGQGRTEGFHERVIPIPPKVKRILTSSQGRAALAKLSERRTSQAALASRRVLKPAIRMLLQGGPDPGELDHRDDRASPWARRLDDCVDAVYFEELWKAVDLEGEEANRRWDALLYDLCRNLLDDAIRSAPVPQARRLRAEARAEWWCHTMAKKHLPGAFPEEGEEHAA